MQPSESNGEIDRWSLHPISYTGPARAWLLALSFAIVGLAFVTLEPMLGYGAIAFSILPAALGGWFYGVWGGLAASLAAILLDVGLLSLQGWDYLQTGLRDGGYAGMATLALIGLAAGWVRGLGERLRRELIEQRRAEGELSQQARVDAAMAELASALLASKSIEEVSALVLGHARRLTGSRYGFAGYLDPASGNLICPTMTGDVWDGCQVEDKDHIFRKFDGLGGWALVNRQALYTNDAPGDPRAAGTPPGHVPIQRFLAAPALFGEKPVGLVALANPDDDYSEQDLAVVKRLAGLYSLAIREYQAEQALLTSEEQYRTLFETTGTASVMVDEHATIILVNSEFENLLGYSKEEMVGSTRWTDFVHPADLEKVKTFHQLRRQDSSLAPSRYELRCTDNRGNLRDILAIISMIPGTKRSIASLIDITESKRANKIQEVTFKISTAAHLSPSLDELYREIHRCLGELLNVENFYIALYDRQTDLVSFPYFVDQYDEPAPPKRPGKGLTEYVLRTGKPLMASPEIFQDLVERGEAELVGAPSIDWVGVPLVENGRTFGVMVVQSYDPAIRFGERELEILIFVSEQVAMAIERKRAEEKLKYLSIHDALTGLYNRGYFEEGLARLEGGRQYPVSLIMADIDDLKQVNDQYGHAAGDEALRQFAQVLKGAFRAEDLIARLGGDEFAVLLPITGELAAQQAVERVRQGLAAHNRDRPPPRLSASLGVATAGPGYPLVEAFKQADAQMYLDKGQGKFSYARAEGISSR